MNKLHARSISHLHGMYLIMLNYVYEKRVFDSCKKTKTVGLIIESVCQIMV